MLAYGAARRFAHDRRFAFGTWKIEVLGGYTSAVFLVGVVGSMLYQSAERPISPTSIHYDQAIAIAVVGLLVNFDCAWLLKDGHAHHHGYPERAVQALRDSGKDADDKLLSHLLPLGWEHIDLTGDYIWRQSRQGRTGQVSAATDTR